MHNEYFLSATKKIPDTADEFSKNEKLLYEELRDSIRLAISVLKFVYQYDQDKIMRYSGLAEATISLIERGEKEIKTSDLSKLSFGLRIPHQFFVWGKTDFSNLLTLSNQTFPLNEVTKTIDVNSFIYSFQKENNFRKLKAPLSKCFELYKIMNIEFPIINDKRSHYLHNCTKLFSLKSMKYLTNIKEIHKASILSQKVIRNYINSLDITLFK